MRTTGERRAHELVVADGHVPGRVGEDGVRAAGVVAAGAVVVLEPERVRVHARAAGRVPPLVWENGD
jgi:hypothetical protein